MKLKVQDVIDVTLVVSQIIRENRPMPQKGKYRLARLHAKLIPEYNTAIEQRDAMIKAYETHARVLADPNVPGVFVETAEWMVPEEKLEDFNTAWKKLAADEIEVDVTPIPLGYLDLGADANGSITANELLTLGDLVTEG